MQMFSINFGNISVWTWIISPKTLSDPSAYHHYVVLPQSFILPHMNFGVRPLYLTPDIFLLSLDLSTTKPERQI